MLSRYVGFLVVSMLVFLVLVVVNHVLFVVEGLIVYG